MATKKDLVEAYTYSRRRLVTAFVSGAPGGREVEPARPGRTIVGGVAIAVLLVAGAAIAGVFAPTAPQDWTQRGLIISKETGAAYVIVDDDDADDPELHPVINATSAALILGADTEPTLIEQDTIDEQRIGSDIGILGAPASVPTPSRLINTGWTACTDADAGVRMTVSSAPDAVPAPDAGITVSNGDDLFAVISDDTGAHVYSVPEQVGKRGDETFNLLDALGLPTDPVPVSREWLALFPTGAPLDYSSFELEHAGSEPAGVSGLEGHTVGELLVSRDGGHFLVTDSGLLELSEFEATVYANVVDDHGKIAQEVSVERPPTAGRDEDTLANAGWPENIPTQAGVVGPCARLVTDATGDAPAVVQLAAAGTATSASGVEAGDEEQVVDAGRGAYVLSGSFGATDQGSPFLIDSKGRANPLVGENAAAQLGYADVPVAVVPDSWIKLFGCGVNLSQEAALAPPAASDRSGCS
jgi:type VII secretion protein EccB